VREVFSIIFLGLGAFFIFVGSLGVLRLPDSLCRSHALSKAITLGISLMLIGFWIQVGTLLIGIKILLALLFLFFTIPLSGHIFALYAVKGEKRGSTSSFKNRVT